MLILAVIWWICIQLSAPTWVFVTLGCATLLRFFTGTFSIFKSMLDLAELGSKSKTNRK